LSYAEVTNGGAVFSIAPSNFGVLGSPLSINVDTAAFSCGKRLCGASQDFSQIRLINGNTPAADLSQILLFNKQYLLAVAINKKLMLIRI
jgi:hypothetical protein